MRLRLVGILSMAVLFAAGCSIHAISRPAPRAYRYVTATQSGQMLDLKEGDFVVILLDAGAPGSRWVVTEKPENATFRRVSRRTREALLGATGQYMVEFRFEAADPGITSLEIELRGKGRSEALDRFSLTVKVTY